MITMKGTFFRRILLVRSDKSVFIDLLSLQSLVMCNVWAIHSNPERFEDPDLFEPERFLEHTMTMADAMAQADPRKRDHFAFGAGKYLARNTGMGDNLTCVLQAGALVQVYSLQSRTYSLLFQGFFGHLSFLRHPALV